jgi:hypothetical protein
MGWGGMGLLNTRGWRKYITIPLFYILYVLYFLKEVVQQKWKQIRKVK